MNILLKPSLVCVTLYDWSSYYGQQRAYLGVERKCVSNQAGVKRELIWSVPKAPTCSPPAPHFLHLWHRNYAWVPQNFTCPKHTPNTHIRTHTLKPPSTTTFSGPRRKVCEKKAICQFTQAHTYVHTNNSVQYPQEHRLMEVSFPVCLGWLFWWTVLCHWELVLSEVFVFNYTSGTKLSSRWKWFINSLLLL